MQEIVSETPARTTAGWAGYFQRIVRKLELSVPSPAEILRKALLRIRGASIGRNTRIPPCNVTWPHQLKIGARCRLQRGIFFNYDHYWTPGPSIVIGDDVFIGNGVEFNVQGRIEVSDRVLIAAGTRLVDHDHGLRLDEPIAAQPNSIAPIHLEEDVWIGANCVILKGVRVGRGAVLGAGSVLTKSIPEFEIWGGIPAKRIGDRRIKQ